MAGLLGHQQSREHAALTLPKTNQTVSAPICASISVKASEPVQYQGRLCVFVHLCVPAHMCVHSHSCWARPLKRHNPSCSSSSVSSNLKQMNVSIHVLSLNEVSCQFFTECLITVWETHLDLSRTWWSLFSTAVVQFACATVSQNIYELCVSH